MIVVNSVLNDLMNVYSYVVYDDSSNDAIIIDPGSNFEDLQTIIKINNIKVHAILLTHGHFDHIVSCRYFQLQNIPIYVGYEDAEMCSNDVFNASKLCGYNIEKFIPDFHISIEHKSMVFGNIKIKIIKTPGHSKGGLSFIIDNYIFTGDTKFRNGYGRDDLFGGNYKQLNESLNVIDAYINKGYILMPGHNY